MSMDRKTRRALARAVRIAPPPGLLRRLLAIPESTRAPAPSSWRWLAAPAALAAVAAVAFVLVRGPQGPEPSPEDALAAEAAVRDFMVAMAYLQKSTEIAGRHTGNEIGNGMLEALVLSREALEDSNNGG